MRRKKKQGLGELFDGAPKAAEPQERKIYTVAELTGEVKALLETAHPAVYVRGEISNFYRHHSGHIYMTLKDEKAQLRAVFFKGANMRLKFEPENGLDVIAFGRLTVYEPRGEYQINVEFLEPAGLGALQLKIEQLKKKLAAEGLFSAERKRPLPEFPREIAVVTSPEGAAVKDFLKVTRMRFPSQHIVIFPAQVQGESAPAQIVSAIQDANDMGGFDVLVVCRGGGSLEDLMAFNDEGVARAIAASEIPTVVGVGHERDQTIADLVADVRAATPSQAAETVTPSRAEVLSWLVEARARLEQRLKSRLEDDAQELDDAAETLAGAVRTHLRDLGAQLRELNSTLRSLSPGRVLSRQRELLEQIASRAAQAVQARLADAKQRTAAAAATLNALSPLAVLKRGYAIAFELPERRVLKDAAQVAPGDRIEVKLSKGSVRAKAEEIDPKGEE